MSSLVEEEYEKYTQEGQWKRVFDKIQQEASVLYSFSCKQARTAENRERNRYRDVSPYDDYRVKLDGCENNYINASRVEVPLVGRTYILTQGPLANTSGHFWLMIWQQDSRGVLMLNKVVEDGRLKCHPYFPVGSEYGGDDSLTFEDVALRVEYRSTVDHACFVVRSLVLVNLKTEESKPVLQFHYIDWPDFGIPKNSESFLTFLYAVRQSGVIPSSPHSDNREEVGPPVIHCSAGIGRSGTFCLVDSALVQVERTKSLLSLDLRSMLIDMRRYRAGLIQRPEQLKFSYMAILDGAHSILAAATPADSGSDVDNTDDLLNTSDDDLGSDASSGLKDDDEDDQEVNVDEDSGPTPPERTTSLTNKLDEGPAAKAPRVNHQEPVEPVAPIERNNIPDPPKRTTSLHKSVSLDVNPPPVPPRPPSTMDRQKSAPGAVPQAEVKECGDDDAFSDDENDIGFENATPRPIGMCNNPMKRKRDEMREEKKQKMREKVDSMVAKQKAAEAAKNSPYSFKKWGYFIGAGALVVVAIGLAYKPWRVFNAF